MSSHFKDHGVSIRSFRKGGAQWFAHDMKVRPEGLQAQGGWRSTGAMNSCYAMSSPDHCKRTLVASLVKPTSATEGGGPAAVCGKRECVDAKAGSRKRPRGNRKSE